MLFWPRLLAFLFLYRLRFCLLYRFLLGRNVFCRWFCALLYSCSFLSRLLRLFLLGFILSLWRFILNFFCLWLLWKYGFFFLLWLPATLFLLRCRLRCRFFSRNFLLGLLCYRIILDRLRLCRSLLHRCSCLLFLRTASASLLLRLFRSVFGVDCRFVVKNSIDKVLFLHTLVAFYFKF